MVDLPRTLRSVYAATLRERDGSYVVEVPKREVEHGSVSAGDVYRVALIEQVAAADDQTDPATASDGRTDARSNGAPESAGRSSEPSPPEPPVSEGEVRRVSVESLGDQGDGIAKVERGYVVIVPDAHPGDEPTVRIDRTKENVAFASVVDRDDRTP
ncbi:TRAM domain-containing protein [Candidatus Halobonum tyrrellensis]|uniref:TRAM domain-containing protein n=1 Tax=Candidatus Halobonum tyrrellensis G22 TaxID=1324957 RepID=V4GNW6_9EURY|nr:TRAM domain-containing protein [Candidatus Halobonum tyrrellensis]ESP87086.1 hypothetical protein K933_16252 [Candidatus Halobonum tyrrellensis G22]